MRAMQRVTLPGSQRIAMPGARATGKVRPDERFDVTIRLRPRAALASVGAGYLDDGPLAKRRYLSRGAYAKKYGTSAADFVKLRAFAKKYGLAVVEESPARHSVVLSGTAAAFSAAFAVTLRYYSHSQGSYRGRIGPIKLPRALAGIVQGVFGLDNRPQAAPRFQVAGSLNPAKKKKH